MNVSHRVVTALVGACAVAAGGGGCSGTSSDAIGATEALVATTTTAPAAPTTSTTIRVPCSDPTLSYRPDGPNPGPEAMPEGSFMLELQSDGPPLRVGVDENTLGLASRNLETGSIEGMEVDLAYEIARRIFGDGPLDEILELVPVTTDEKVDVVVNGTVDLTIDAVTMRCDRWQEVDFSTEYLTAEQEFLVRSDSSIDSDADLIGRTVCVTKRSSSLSLMEDHVPDAVLLPVDLRGDCLLALQQGTADAYFGHDTFLRGMVLQDPTMEIRDLLDVDTTSHYGIAIVPGHEDFVRFVNQALEDMRIDGTWARLHREWLEQGLGMPPALPPDAAYIPEPA